MLIYHHIIPEPSCHITLSVPRRGGDLVGQVVTAQLVLLVGQRVVKGVDTDVLPETVEAVLLRGGTGTSNLEDTAGDLESHVGGGDLAGSDGLGDLTTLAGSQVQLVTSVAVEQVGDLLASDVTESVGSANRGEVAAVLGEDVVLVEGALLGVVGEGPGAGGGGGVALGGLEGTAGDTVVEVGEDELEDGAQEGLVGGLEELLDGLPGLDVEAKGVLPLEGDLLNLAGARLGQTHTHVLPVVGELEAGLLGGDDGEDMVAGLHVDTLENDEVGESAAGGEVLETVEDKTLTIGGDAAVVVTGVDGSTDERVGLEDGLLPALLLLLGTDDAGEGGPLQVVTQEHTNRAVQLPFVSLQSGIPRDIGIDLPIANSELTDSTEGNLPGLATTTVLGVTEDLGETGALQERNLSVGDLLLNVTGSSVGGEDASDLLGTLNPSGGRGREALSGEGIVVSLVDSGVGSGRSHCELVDVECTGVSNKLRMKDSEQEKENWLRR